VSSRFRFAKLLIALALVACGGGGAATFGPGKVDIPVNDGSSKNKAQKRNTTRESPPPSGVARDAPFPAVAKSKLPNGLGVDVITARALPVVQVRLLVRAGSGFASPGVAELTAQMLKDGGTRALTSAELLRRVETLGANLSVRSDHDAIVLALALTKDQVDAGLSLLSQVVREPRFDDGELKKTKARATDEAEDTARSSGSWTATWLVFHELFPEKHPYARYGLLPSQIAKVDGAQVREFHRRFFVPKASTLVLAGDLDEAQAKELANRHFGAWTGGDPPKIDFGEPQAPKSTRVVIAHRPKSVQSDVYVALLAPERRSENWAHVRVANQVLGGGVASRLFADVREQRSLAYRATTQIFELAHGKQPLVAYAGTETSKTAQAAAALVENISKMTSSPPSADETAIARRYLADLFAIRMETIGSIAEMVVTQEVLGLPDGYWDTYKKALRATEADDAKHAASAVYGAGDNALIVVAGDADAIAQGLTRFGEVTVVDAEKEFKVMKTIPQAPK
jgi:zinc protease